MNSDTGKSTTSRRLVDQPFWRRLVSQWLPFIICILASIAFLLGLVGFFIQYYAARPDEPDWSIPFFRTVQLFLLNSSVDIDTAHLNNWYLTVARSAAALWFLVISSTVVVRIIVEVRKLSSRLMRKGHVVIAGLGPIGLQVLDDLRRNGRSEKIVVIESNPNSPWLDHARRQGADVVIGDAKLGEVLEQARARYARSAFVATGNDGDNLEIAAELAERIRTGNEAVSENIKLYMHIEDGNLATSVQQHAGNLHETKNLDLRVFNVPRNVAAHLITRQLWPHAPKEKDQVAHFVIIGFGTMGQALAVQLAKLAHFPNLKRSRFTIADRDIQASATAFLSRYPRFTSWTPGQLGVNSFSDPADLWANSSGVLPKGVAVNHPDAVQYVANAKFMEITPTSADELFVKHLAEDFQSSSVKVKPMVFICGQQDRENFDAAIAIKEKLACFGYPNVPTFVWMPRQPALVAALERDKRIQPFGECRIAASLEEIERPMREVLAVTLHNDYEAHAVKRGDKKTPNPWNERDPFRESNLEAADHLHIKLAALGYELRYRDQESQGPLVEFDEIMKSKFEMLAIMEHNRWMAERLMSGWRFIEKATTPEEVTANKQRKLHHDLVPWERLCGERDRDFEQITCVLEACQKIPFRLEKNENDCA